MEPAWVKRNRVDFFIKEFLFILKRVIRVVPNSNRSISAARRDEGFSNTNVDSQHLNVKLL